MDKLENDINNGIIEIEVVESIKVRMGYAKPQLEELGDLRTLTLGITQGVNESGPYTPNRF